MSGETLLRSASVHFTLFHSIPFRSTFGERVLEIETAWCGNESEMEMEVEVYLSVYKMNCLSVCPSVSFACLLACLLVCLLTSSLIRREESEKRDSSAVSLQFGRLAGWRVAGRLNSLNLLNTAPDLRYVMGKVRWRGPSALFANPSTGLRTLFHTYTSGRWSG